MAIEQEVFGILGGGRLLGGEVSGLAGFDPLIRKGFSWATASYAQLHLQLSDKSFAEILEKSDRTLSRMRKNKARLDLVASDRLFRMAKIVAFARMVLEGHEAAMEWLQSPQIGLGERTPLEMIRTEAGAQAVMDLLGRMEYGVVS